MEKLESKRYNVQTDAASTDAAPKQDPVKDTIQFDDFVKLDIRTGTIAEASKVEKADKLLKLVVDLGFEKRTVVSGYCPAL